MEHAFPCGNVALDFVGSLKARRNAAPVEKFGSPRSLDAWFRESGVVDGDTASKPSDVAAAITLREAIYSLVAAKLAGTTPDGGAITVVNRAALKPPAVPQLTSTGRRNEGLAEQAMSTVARVAIDILSGPDADLLKECGRPECTQVYLDRSRGSRREWCAMETCGNKMKAAAYRARKRGNPPLAPSRTGTR
jgi:predicted RNA-binding Zn ribbon-like protein